MDAIEKRARERARFDAWVKASGSYSWNGFNRMEDMWDAWQGALTPPEGSDQNLLELAATIETCIPFLPSAGQRNIGKAVAQLRHMAMGYVLVDSKLLGAVRVARLAILQKEAEAEQMDEPHDASMWAECAADLDAIAPRGMLAARPEVKP